MNDSARLARLDILRGVGAVLVLYRHFFDSFLPSFKTPHWPVGISILAEGEIGVALFCVISGFIFEYLVRGKEINYLAFIKARCWRIYPLYGLVLLIAAAMLGGDYFRVIEQLVGFVGVSQAGDVFGATWSIPIEFQFYLAFPFLTLILAKRGCLQIVSIVAFFIAMRTGLFFTGRDVNSVGYWSIAGRADQFLIGMLAANIYYGSRFNWFRGWSAFIASLVGVATATQYFHSIYGADYPWSQSPMTHWFSIAWPTVQAVMFAALILSFLRLPARIPVVVERPLLFLGNISFSLYIMHRLIDRALGSVLDFHAIQFTALEKLDALLTCTLIDLPLAVAVGALAHYAIEEPFFQFKKPYLRSKASEHIVSNSALYHQSKTTPL